MKNVDVIRAWKDQSYRDSLTSEERASLPDSPAGEYVLDTEVMKNVVGGWCFLSLIASEGAVCTVSGECNGGAGSCNPFT